MNRILITCLLLAVSCWGAPQSAAFTGSNYLRFTPSGSPWSSLTSWRVEFRMHGFGTASQVQGIYGNNDGDGQCQIPASATFLRCRTYRGTSNSLEISLVGRTDVRVRFQRFNATGTLTMEMWNADGTGYATTQLSYTPEAYDGRQQNYVGALWGSGSQFTGSISYVRWYSATVPLGSSLPPDSVSTAADLFDVELDGDVSDSSPAHRAVSVTGAVPVFSNTALFPPVAKLISQSVRAGRTMVLDASNSSNLTDDQPLQYFWTCVSTPSPCEFTQRNGSSARLRTLISGPYTVRLQVTDSQKLSDTVDVEMGAVATDENGVVILPSNQLNLVLGPMLRSGSSPWSWFDETEQKVADALIASIPDSPGQIPLSGSVSASPGSSTVTGSGTAFLSTFSCNGQDRIMLFYPLTGGGTGRRAYTVNSCSSNTSLTIETGYDAGSVAATGMNYGKLTNAESAQWVNGSNNWNYYDAVVALYRVYYRTGRIKYRDAARSLADKWWVYPIDGGRGSVSGARSVALFGLMLRALDGKPEYWPGIVSTAQLHYGIWLSGYYPYQPNQAIGEIREQGYVSMWTILLAILHPDPAVRSTWLSNANTAFNYWKANQNADGSWRFTLDASLYYSGTGTLPWQSGFVATYLTMLHRHTGNPDVLAVLKKLADFMASYGVDPDNDAGYYDVFYTRCPAYSQESQGTVNVVAGSKTITGNNTNFQSRYACNQTDRIGIDLNDGTRAVYTVQACASNTSMTITQAHLYGTESGRRHLLFPATGPTHGCGICAFGTCGKYGTDASSKKEGRTLLNASHAYWGYLYMMGQGNNYKTIGDRLFAQNIGAGGPGNDGVYGHYNDVISGGSAPNYLAYTYLSKEFAFVGGAAGAQPYLAWRLGTQVPAQPVSVKVSIALGSVPNAAKARVTVTKPNGETVQTECTSSPCIVEADRRQGDHQVTIEYLKADNKVLAVGERNRLAIP